MPPCRPRCARPAPTSSSGLNPPSWARTIIRSQALGEYPIRNSRRISAERPRPARYSRAAPAAAAALLGPRIVVLPLELHPIPVREHLHRVDEVEPLRLLDEPDRVPLRLAPEAVEELVRGIDRERRRPLVVERAQPGEPGPHPAQVGLGPHQLDHVDRVAQPVDRIPREEPHQSPTNALIAKRSVIPASQSTTRCSSDASSVSGGGGSST